MLLLPALYRYAEFLWPRDVKRNYN